MSVRNQRDAVREILHTIDLKYFCAENHHEMKKHLTNAYSSLYEVKSEYGVTYEQIVKNSFVSRVNGHLYIFGKKYKRVAIPRTILSSSSGNSSDNVVGSMFSASPANVLTQEPEPWPV